MVGKTSAKTGKMANTPFHGDNTGSNPVGDANKINDLDRKAVKQINSSGNFRAIPLKGHALAVP